MLRVTIENDETTITTDTDTQTVPVSRHTFQAAIARYVWCRYTVRIGAHTAAVILDTIGSAYPLSHELGMILYDAKHRVLLTSEEIRDVLRAPLGVLIETLRTVHAEHAVQLTGAGAALRGLDLLITEETGLVCHIF